MIKIYNNPAPEENESKKSAEAVIKEAREIHKAAQALQEEQKYLEALEREMAALTTMKGHPDYEDLEFKALLVETLFLLAEIHYGLKNYKQSEKELDFLFKVLDNLVKTDDEIFGKFHILAMELSTRIIRSRKKAMDMLIKQQINAESLYEKVDAGMVAATDRLVESLRNVGSLMASTGDLQGALKFYAEAIKFSKKRTGKVTRKEVKMTIEMAEIMMRLRQMRPRAKRLLEAILPHAISLETIELEQDIISLIEVIDKDMASETKWKLFIHKITNTAKTKLKKGKKEEKAKDKKEKSPKKA